MKINSVDKEKLCNILLHHPFFGQGGRIGTNKILQGAGLPEGFINSLYYIPNLVLFAEIIFDELKNIHSLIGKTNYSGLGALAKYLLDDSKIVDNTKKIFLSYFITKYKLIRNQEVIEDIIFRYNHFRQVNNERLDLGWTSQKLPPSILSELTPETVVFSEVPFLNSSMLTKGSRVTSSVCKIETVDGIAFGTGFLVAPDLILTNYHVIPKARAVDKKTKARFLDIMDEYGNRQRGFVVDIKELITFSEYDKNDSSEYLDFSLLKLSVNIEEKFQIKPIIINPEVISNEGDMSIIVQYPGGKSEAGQPLQFVLDAKSKIIKKVKNRIRYTTNTRNGSSGAPVFNLNWEVIGIHHASATTDERIHNAEDIYAYNQGISIKPIYEQIKKYLTIN